MSTLCITATIFDDRTTLAYSTISRDGDDVRLSPVHQCEASAQSWGYLLYTLPDAALPCHYDVRIGVIDRRPGTRATSRSRGISLTEMSR